MGKTLIEWADRVWNPLTGCSHAGSPGCDHCYAKRMATRLKGRYGYPKDDPFRVTFHPERLDDPVRWKKPSRIFPCSMGDLFYYGKSFHVEEHHVRQSEIFKIMKGNPRHTYLLLTKRPENMAWWAERFIGWWGSIPGNWWLGVSVSTNEDLWMVETLSQIPAAKRFVSVEPMLGPIDVSKWLNAICCYKCGGPLIRTQLAGCHTYDCKQCGPDRRAAEVKDCLDWVICGGETGPGARPLHPDWVRSIRDQCQVAGVPFFFKGWGEWFPVGEKLAGEFKPIGKGDALKRLHLWPDQELSMRTGRKAAGRFLDGREWNEYPK